MRVGAGVRVAPGRRRRAPRLPGRRGPRGAGRDDRGCRATLERGREATTAGFLREPDLGFAWAAYRWASGHQLDAVLQRRRDLAAGDFVRWIKQLIDLLGQVADAAPRGSGLRTHGAARPWTRIRRGVVAYSSVS